jgi:mono/diheme cytochrome c family protein
MKRKLAKTNALGLLFTVASLAIVQITVAEGNHQGGHGDKHWMSPKEAAARVNPIQSDAPSIERGKKTYLALCSACHGVTAEGDGIVGSALDPKPTNLKAMSGRHEDGDFAWKIANGRGAMPAWKATLKQDQIWDLVNYIQNLKNDQHEKSDDHHSHSKSHTH